VRYVALGDSYTIGTSVAEVERWPNQLVAALAPDLTGDLASIRLASSSPGTSPSTGSPRET